MPPENAAKDYPGKPRPWRCTVCGGHLTWNFPHACIKVVFTIDYR